MNVRPKILILDDGELTNVLTTLGELGLHCVRVPWKQYDADRHFPSQLLILTARYAFLRLKPPQNLQRPLRPVRVVFMDHYSQSAQQRLLDCGADFLVRHPTPSTRLREILQHALAGDGERRSALRTTIHDEIRVRDGLVYRHALLEDLSLTGCQLITSLPFKEGSTVQVQLASILPRFKSLCVPGKIVRSNRRRELRFGEITNSGICFEPFGSETRQQLETVLMFHETSAQPSESAAAPTTLHARRNRI